MMSPGFWIFVGEKGGLLSGEGEDLGLVVPYEELRDLAVRALEGAGVPADDARTCAEVLLRADLGGVSSHRIERLFVYMPRLRSGLINPRPSFKVLSVAPAIRLVWGDNGLGPVVAVRGVKEAVLLARRTGVAFVGCRDSNHFGSAAPYVLMACEEELIGIAGTNAFPTMAPWGSLDPLVGNNPLAIGVPCKDGPHFVLDMAMSVSSRGRIRQMAQRGERLPQGWAVDINGNPTTDPLEALRGLVLPIGGHKGYGLALAMDILSGVLTGSGFSTGVKSLFQQWQEPQHVGHFFIVIDPARFMSLEKFQRRMSRMRRRIKRARPIDDGNPVFLPGEIEARLEEERRISGIPMRESTLERLKRLAEGRDSERPPAF